jgi:hypothetical protein
VEEEDDGGPWCPMIALSTLWLFKFSTSGTGCCKSSNSAMI